MALILCIDTAGSIGRVLFSKDGQLMQQLEHHSPTEHASFVQPAVAELAGNLGIKLSDLDAVAVSNGPGSYTGVRVGLASAKGICYALAKPLLTLNTLLLMAKAARDVEAIPFDGLICPMIDARREEVFFAVYDAELQMQQPTQAAVLSNSFLAHEMEAQPVWFVGNGVPKWQKQCQHPNARFLPNLAYDGQTMAIIAEAAYSAGQIADLAYAEPFYGKAFYSTHVSHTLPK